MANELTISASMLFQKTGYGTLSVTPTSRQVTIAGGITAQIVQSINTSDTTLTLPADLATIGYCLFENLDATNFILIGEDGTSWPVKILPGKFALFQFNGSIHVKADTAICLFKASIIEP